MAHHLQHYLLCPAPVLQHLRRDGGIRGILLPHSIYFGCGYGRRVSVQQVAPASVHFGEIVRRIGDLFAGRREAEVAGTQAFSETLGILSMIEVEH